jgi:PPOX class probable F420-dependent enzyme
MAADLALVRRLVKADRGLAVVAVARGDGSVHASVVNAGVWESESGHPEVAFVARGGTKKLDHIRGRGRATVVFRHGWEWVAVDGPARIVGPDEAGPDQLPELLRTVFTAAGGTHEDWATFDRVMAEEGRVAVFVLPQRITSNG